ncbi:MAG TPA: cellulose synthase operon protein YhjQ/BcsQ [Anaerolineales bacterium]|nr:cellulose synthase operon protein YhjQ/BcsQ [Anaerolineales bacterium]
MTKVLALAGKGGTGKTTLAALLIRSLLRRGQGPVLAIDADPAMNLHLALGLPAPTTVGELREDVRGAQLAVSRHEYLTHQVRLAVEEGDQVDLLAMGRPEGQGCYCAVNHLLRQILDDLGKSYTWVVVDNEAGMEHISRRTTRDVDLLVVVTDPTVRGARAAQTIAAMAAESDVAVRRKVLVVNRVRGDLPSELSAAFEATGLPIAAMLPADDRLSDLDAQGISLLQLNGASPAGQAVEALTDQVLESMEAE